MKESNRVSSVDKQALASVTLVTKKKKNAIKSVSMASMRKHWPENTEELGWLAKDNLSYKPQGEFR